MAWTRLPTYLVPIALSAPSAVLTSNVLPATADPSHSTVRVAVANVHEGSHLRFRADRRDATDRRAFARRLLAAPGPLPDVLLLQETLGTAGRVAAALNAHRRTRSSGARYAVATATGHGFSTGTCDGSRTGRFSVLRSSSILVNMRTVTRIHEQGTIRTWGRWAPRAWRVTGRRGYGCSEHPWIRATVETPGGPRTVLAASVHFAPNGLALKNRAAGTVAREVESLRAGDPATLLVLGGDLNLNRCPQPLMAGEQEFCDPRAGHRKLIAAGQTDAVRTAHRTGPSGVVGLARRIDFVYSTGTVTAAWHDRCYLAHLVRRWPCGADRSVFARQRLLRQCQARSLHHGRPGGGCSPSAFRRYYSDHPILLATLR